MAVFHVFVDGATDTSPGAIERLGQAIAAHYGLGAPDLVARLQKGRFRVKGNTDRATADTYARDLARLGARVTIEEATADNSQRSTPLPFPAVRPATPPAGLPVASGQPIPVTGLAAAGPRPPSTTPPSAPTSGAPAAAPVYSSALAAAGAAALAAPGFRPQSGKPSVPPPTGGAGTPSTPPPIGAAPAGGFTSGLSAAFSGDQPAADLGALGGGDAAFSLASLDGVDDSSPTGGSIGPAVTAGGSGGGMAASIGPAMLSSSGGGAATTPSAPLDMFAPPDAADAQLAVDIASDEQDFSARKRASTPPPVEAAADARPSSQRLPTTPTTGQLRKSQPIPVPTAPVTVLASAPSKFGPLGNERVRFAAGVVLAVLLGFIPAHFISKAKAESAESAIDRKVIAAQQAADTPEVYANLDRMRADQLDRKESEHRNAAIIGFAIWALVGSGIAFVWFRKIPWDA